MRTPILSVLLVLAGVTAAKAQTTESFFSVYGGLAVPTGKFGDDIGPLADGIGRATTGFMLGAEYVHSVEWSNLPRFGWISSAFFTHNGRDSEDFESVAREYERGMEKLERQLAEFNFEHVLDYEANASTGSWPQVSLLSGLQYQVPLNPRLDVYGALQIGLMFVSPPDLAMSASAEVTDIMSDQIKIDVDFERAVSPAIMLHGGLLIRKRYSVSLRLLSASPRLKYQVVVDRDIHYVDEYSFLVSGVGDVGFYEEGRNAYEQPISAVQLLAGLRF